MTQEFNISEEAKKRALEKPNFNILYVSENESRLSPFRGDIMMKTFANFYSKQANINLLTANVRKANTLTLENLGDTNIIWLDNITDPGLVTVISKLQEEVMNEVSPGWRDILKKLETEDKEAAVEFVRQLKVKRTFRLKVIYAIDEFVWEAPVGRTHTLLSAFTVESYLNSADTVVVPNETLIEAITHFGLCNKFIQFCVIPTAMNHEFLPLHKNFKRQLKLNNTIDDKPKVLVKGLTIPENVQEFIKMNYKKFNITISSVGDLDEQIIKLIGNQKVSHIQHWANPYVNKTNFSITYAFERDKAFDFMIYTMPDNVKNKMYDLTTGEEDVLFAIANGTLPICGIEDIGYEKTHLFYSSGLVFGKDTDPSVIASLINSNYNNHMNFNESYGKCRASIEKNLSSSPFVLSIYYAVCLGKEISDARADIAKQKREEEQKLVEQETSNTPEIKDESNG